MASLKSVEIWIFPPKQYENAMLTTAPPLHTDKVVVHKDNGAVHKDDCAVRKNDGSYKNIPNIHIYIQ